LNILKMLLPQLIIVLDILPIFWHNIFQKIKESV
jgi:hypothetical protein